LDRRWIMKLFLTTAVLAAVLSTSAYAQNTSPEEKQGAPTGQVKSTTQEPGGMASGAKASTSGAAMKKDSTSGAGTPKDSAGSKDAPGEKTGVSGGSGN
jgi:hypothetical protein